MPFARPSRFVLLLAALAAAVAACPRTPAAPTLEPPPPAADAGPVAADPFTACTEHADAGGAAQGADADAEPVDGVVADVTPSAPDSPPTTDSAGSPPAAAAPSPFPLDPACARTLCPIPSPLSPAAVFGFAEDWTGASAPFLGARVGPRYPAPASPSAGTLIEVPVDRNGNVTAAAPVVRTFEKTFTVDDPSTAVAAFVEAQFAGGIVVRLNGREWLRSQVDPELDGPDDPAVDLEDDGRFWLRRRQGGVYQRSFPGLDPRLLRAGPNTLSVDVHRPPAPDADPPVRFDLRLDLYDAHGFVVAPFLTGSADGAATVAWDTTAPTTGRVRYGSGTAADLEAGDGEVCATHHEVPLPPLEAGAVYGFGVEWSPCAAWAPEADRAPRWDVAGSVRGLPAPGTPFTFFAYGDTRAYPKRHTQVVDAMRALLPEVRPVFLVHTGDLTNIGTDEREWQEQFFGPLAPLLAHVPLVPALGNHEFQDEDWFDRLALPGNEAWYAVRAGDVELFVLDTYAKFAPRTPQLRWLEEALAASDAPWKIVSLHLPLRSCMARAARRQTADRLAAWLLPILQQHGVRLVLSGHDHLYGRALLDGDIANLTLGGGGAPTYAGREAREGEVCVSTTHFARVDVAADRLHVRVFDVDGVPLDDFEVLREPDAPAADSSLAPAGEADAPPQPTTD